MAARRGTKPIRKDSEFNLALLASLLTAPIDSTLGVYTWDLPQIRAARDEQLRGRFQRPVQMAASMRTDDALFTAYENRLDPQRCIGVEIVPAPSGRQSEAKRIAAEADVLYGPLGTAVTVDTLADINGDLANHGIAIGYNTPVVRDDGSRVDLLMYRWPLDAVQWDPLKRMLTTRVEMIPTGAPRGSFFDVPIVHGDGRWVVFAKHECEPWRQEACILPAALIWARHAAGVRDWSKGSTSHGNAKVVGEMPEEMALTNADGTPTKEAVEMLALLRAIASQEQPVGIRPAGSKTEYLTNDSRAWQVWQELVTNAEKAAARVYLGTDGMLGSQGGAPGVDIATLFGVATTKVQGDLKCIERAIKTGVLDPWCAINFGDSSLAPTRRYMMPDADADADANAYAARSAAFHADIKEHRANGFLVDEDLVKELAERYGVRAPKIDTAPPKPEADPAPKDEDESEDIAARLRLVHRGKELS